MILGTSDETRAETAAHIEVDDDTRCPDYTTDSLAIGGLFHAPEPFTPRAPLISAMEDRWA